MEDTPKKRLLAQKNCRMRAKTIETDETEKKCLKTKYLNETGLEWQRINEISLTGNMLNIMFAFLFGNYTDGNLESETKNKSGYGDHPECQDLIRSH